MRIINGRVLLGNTIAAGACLYIKKGKIAGIGGKSPRRYRGAIDASGLFVSPGFIDTHIHGDAGKVIGYQARYGTTAIVSAISCATPGSIGRSLRRLARFKKSCASGRSVLGARIEGPFISRKSSGAQNGRYIVSPSEAALRRILRTSEGMVKIVTIAPELEGSEKIVKILKKKGIIASMGHTDAGYAEAAKGISCGITHATHLPNGMRRDARGDSAILACLDDKRVVVEMIFDLVHVPERLLRKFLRIKRKDRVVLVTDSVRAEMGGRKAVSGAYRLKDGTIAGSDLTMIGAVRNAVRHCGVGISDAVAMATINPARLMGVDAHKGSISEGKDADLVIFDKNFDVKMTIVCGRIIYRKRGF